MYNGYYMTNVEKELCKMNSFEAIKRTLTGVELHDLQCIDVMKMLAAKRSMIIYDTGTGKTLLAAAAMQLLWNEDPTRKFIMFVKKDQLIQTPEKLRKFIRRDIVTSAADANSIQSLIAQDFSDYGVLMLTHDCLLNEKIINALYSVRNKYCGIIIDEAHELSNAYHARSAKMLSAIVGNFEYCWALTATPIRTNIDQLVKLAVMIDPTTFGQPNTFRAFLRRDPYGVEEFPTKLIIRGGEEFGGKREYNGQIVWVKALASQISGNYSNTFMRYKGPGAYPQAQALVDTIKKHSGLRGLIYVNQHVIREWLLPILESNNIRYECINGLTPGIKRQEIMHKFNELKDIDVVLTSVTTAVDLDCDYVIFYEFTSDVKQMIGRAHRGLGSKTLDIIFIITEDTEEVDYFINNVWDRCELTRSILGQSYSGLDDIKRGVDLKYAEN